MYNSLFKTFYNIESRKHGMLYVFNLSYYLITMIIPSIVFIVNGIDHGYFAMNFYYLFTILLLATINGYIIFKYLHDKHEIDYLHSLPADRDEILYSKLLFGFNVYILPTIISLAILYFVLLAFRPNTLINQNELIKMFFFNTLYYLVSYLIMSFLMCASGNSIFAIFSSLLIQFLGYILVFSSFLLRTNFNSSNNNSQILDLFFKYLSPINIYINIAENTKIIIPIIPIVFLIIYIIIFFKLCKYSFINRPLEKYDKVFAFDGISRIFHIIVSGLFGFIGGELILLFYEYNLNTISKLIILVVGNIVLSTIIFIVIEMIYNKKITIGLNKIIDYILSILIPVFIVALYTYMIPV